MINITPLTKTQKFIEKAKIIHGDRYDYSLVEYVGAKIKVNIKCIKHGVFLQTPNDHLQDHGCPKCAGVGKDTDQFIKESNIIHNNRYDYSLTNYIRASLKINVICKKHGIFKQVARDHLSGYGCQKCANKVISDSKLFDSDVFILKSKSIHNNIYNYSLVDYKGIFHKIKIICNIHGIFTQQPLVHIKGHGCPKCKSSKGEQYIREYLIQNNIIFEEQKKFSNCVNIKQLPFDFYIPGSNLIIEYHGDQHYKPIKFFGGDKVFDGVVKRDKIKQEFCIQNNISYIELNKDNINTIQSQLFEYVKYIQ